MQQVRITFFGYRMNAECIRHHAPDFERRRLPQNRIASSSNCLFPSEPDHRLPAVRKIETSYAKVDVRIKTPFVVVAFSGTLEPTKNTLTEMVPQKFCTPKVTLLQVKVTIKKLPMR